MLSKRGFGMNVLISSEEVSVLERRLRTWILHISFIFKSASNHEIRIKILFKKKKKRQMTEDSKKV